jgi:dienelactone hydrolase
MKRHRLLLAAAMVLAALVMLFGCGACCMLSPHRCAPKTKPKTVAKPEHPAFSANGITHDVYEFGGGGPDVILLHELPGFSYDTITLVSRLKAEPEHYNVHVPLIFGDFNSSDAVRQGFGKCFNEFNCLGNGDSRFAGWLRALIAQRYAGRKVIVIGMCLTGSVALEVADAPGVVGVVMAQPLLPLPLTLWQRPKIGVTDEHAAKIKTPILAMRYSEDCMATRERFNTLRAKFHAPQIEFEEVPSANCKATAHATLTGDYSALAYAHLTKFLREHAKL